MTVHIETMNVGIGLIIGKNVVGIIIGISAETKEIKYGRYSIRYFRRVITQVKGLLSQEAMLVLYRM